MSCTACGLSLGKTEEEYADILDGMCLGCFRELTGQTDVWYDKPPATKILKEGVRIRMYRDSKGKWHKLYGNFVDSPTLMVSGFQLISQQGYEIDSQGNVGNETRRIEDLQLRFVLLMYVINTTIEDEEAKARMSEQAVRTCHKESGIPMSELVSLIKRMTKQVKEIGECIEKNSEEMRDFF